MLIKSLLVAHIAVLGYWLGSELVINSTFRFVSKAANLPFFQRKQLLDHVMVVDQHVRYALALQLGLGLILAVLYEYLPGGAGAAVLASVATLALLAFVEVVHRARKTSYGARLAAVDRSLRYIMIAAFAVGGAAIVATYPPAASWLGWKVILFAVAIACGLAIRIRLIGYFRTFADIGEQGSNPELESRLYAEYWRATSILFVLWAAIAGMTILSVWKPR